jgi:hypothetical protein
LITLIYHWKKLEITKCCQLNCVQVTLPCSLPHIPQTHSVSLIGHEAYDTIETSSHVHVTIALSNMSTYILTCPYSAFSRLHLCVFIPLPFVAFFA